MSAWEQQTFDLEPLGLKIEPTSAMLSGNQEVAQHSWCGTVLVWSNRFGKPGRCPLCPPEHADDSWWEETIGRDGLAGLRQIETTGPGSQNPDVTPTAPGTSREDR